MQNFLMRNFYLPDNINNEEQIQAWILRIILIPSMVITLVVGFIDPSLEELRFVALGLFIVEIFVLGLLVFGKIKPASIIFICAAWLTIMYLAFQLGGMESAVLYFSVVILLLSGILLNSRVALAFLIINIIVITLFYVLENNNMMPIPNNPTTPLRRWAVYLGMYILVSIIIHLSLSTNRQAVNQSLQKEIELANRNQELIEIQGSLEQRMADRTTALERRATQLQVAVDVGRTVVSKHNLEDTLNQVVKLISNRFDVYHAGIFLLDSHGEYAVLRAANSVGGKKMLAHGYKLKIGDVGNVGYVTKTGESRLALNESNEVTHFNNLDLPDTRSEMTLPLKVGDHILGALDVQSIHVNAFSQEDLLGMQVVADLLAIAVQNHQLLAEHRFALDAARRAYQGTSQAGWSKFLEQRGPIGYIGSVANIQENKSDINQEMREVFQENQQMLTGDTLILPIMIREKTTGVLRLKKNSNLNWSEKEVQFVQELNNQLGQTLETARLFTETQQRAERERLTSEIVNRMRTVNDPHLILKSALSDLQKAIGVKQAQIHLEDGTSLAVEANSSEYKSGQEQSN